MEISACANQTLNIAKVFLGFGIYDIQLPDILYHFQNLA